MIASDGHINWRELDESLADKARRAKNLRPAFAKIRPLLRRDQRDHAKNEQGPESKWPPRSAATEERRRSRNRGVRTSRAMRTVAVARFRRRTTPKKVLGRLPGAIAVTTGTLFARASSRAKFGAAHQFGARVGRRRKVRLPARPFLWLSRSLLEASAHVLAEHVAGGGG